MGFGPNEVSGVGRGAFYTNLVNFTNKAKITNKLVILALAFRIRIKYSSRGVGFFGTGVRGWGSGQMRCPGLAAIPFTQI